MNTTKYNQAQVNEAFMWACKRENVAALMALSAWCTLSEPMELLGCTKESVFYEFCIHGAEAAYERATTLVYGLNDEEAGEYYHTLEGRLVR